MPRATTATLVLLLSVPSAPAALAGERSGREVYAEASAIAAELDPLVREITALRLEETKAADPAPFLAVRARLYPRAGELLTALQARHNELIRLARQRVLLQAADVLAQKGGRPLAGARPGLGSALQVTELEHRIGEQKRAAETAIYGEQVAWALLNARAAEERRGEEDRPLVVLCLVTVVSLLSAAAWRLRKSREGPPAMPAQAASLPSPASAAVGSFRLLAEAGSSAYGPVYAAEDPEGRPALLQLVEAAPAPGPDREALLLALGRAASLGHRNLAPMRPVAGDPARFAVAFDCWPSRSLRRLLDARRCEPAWARSVLLQVARGLACAHAAGIVHGGLTPDEIRILDDGAVRLCNLGLGPALCAARPRPSGPGALGAPAYLAPEQESGLGRARPESDVFSLGAVLYEMATGSPPFPGPNFAAQKRERAWRPPCALSSGWPSALDEVAAKALQPDPSRRYPSCREMLAALDRLR